MRSATIQFKILKKIELFMSEVSNYFLFRRNKVKKLSINAAKEKKLDIYFSVDKNKIKWLLLPKRYFRKEVWAVGFPPNFQVFVIFPDFL